MKEETGTGAGCPSDYQLDSCWLDGGSADHSLQQHLDGCQRCRDRLSERDRVREIFEQEVFPATSEQVSERAAAGGFRQLFFWSGTRRLAVGGALLLLLVATLLVWKGLEPGERESNYTGIKGSVGLQVWCRRGDHTFRVHPGDTLLPGDAIRFVVVPPRAGYLMIVSVDSRGNASRYHPAGSLGAVRVKAGELVVPGSTVLDQSRGPERIFALFSVKAFDFETVQKAVRGSADTLDRLPVELDQTSLLFMKGKP